MRARIRNIKPEVLSDEELWDAEQRTGLPLYRAFTGLWMYADKEGRFEWRPRALRSLILPYWDGDFELVLAALEDGRFVIRYDVAGRTYGLVRTFREHQSPNHKEPDSRIPPPPSADSSITQESPGTAQADLGQAQEQPSKAREGLVLVPGFPGSSGNGNGNGNGTKGARAPLTRARAREARGHSAPEIQERFTELYRARFAVVPYLGGGEVVEDFADRLVGTAEARGVEPLVLLEQVFERWAAQPPEDITRRAPYATFAARFGALLDAPAGNGLSEREQLQAQQAEAIKAKDMERYRALAAEERARFGGGSDAH
jgi:hypothetical protein